ncbi:MAG: TonB-dependent receptor plug domain-containing protein [Bacteroidota bacterium]|nr:TonB-dependent receptor plug domain-containing protein [Bacteroidota bacterium]
MRNKILLIAIIFSIFTGTLYAQDQTITGTVTDETSGAPIERAAIILYKGSKNVAATRTDEQGRFTLKVRESGVYDSLKFRAPTPDVYPKVYTKVSISSGQSLIFKVTLSNKVTEVYVTFDPNLNVKKTTQENVISGDDLQKTPAENLGQAIQTTGGVIASGGGFSIRGSRTDNTLYVVDGVRTRGLPTLSRRGIKELSITTGGVPAEYGDVLGGVVSITTRGMADEYSGSVEVRTSEFLDPFSYNFIEGTFTGPLIFQNRDENNVKQKNSFLKKKGKSSRAILGFFAAGTIQYLGVNSPPAIDMYQVKDQAFENIKNNPIAASPTGGGFVSTANFITKDDLNKTRFVPNTASINYSFTGKISLAPTENSDFTVGVTGDRNSRNAYIYTYNLYNSANNPLVTTANTRVFARYTQRFKEDTTVKGGIKNPYYTVQADYTNNNNITQDESFKDNLFAYGYIGRFTRDFRPNYIYTVDTVDGKRVQSNYLQGFQESRVTFTPGTYNPLLANYNTGFFNSLTFLDQGSAVSSSFAVIQAAGGLLNGQTPTPIYSLWSAPGTRFGNYNKNSSEQFFVNIKGGFEINKHRITIGAQYQQNVIRSYDVGVGNQGTSVQTLWTLARQLTNRHLTTLDRTKPIPVYDQFGVFTDTINYPYAIAASGQSTFDKNFRNYLISIGARDNNGKLIDQTSLINIDQYKPEELKLSYFSQDELLNNGNSYVSYYGYDHLGNKVKGRGTLNNFLDSNRRNVGAYNPIYVAGYIEDQFSLKDITFRIGLRVDRFDANQKVLKDQYSLYPTRTAGSVNTLGNRDIVHPSNIGSDYVVYVDDALNPTRIVGYRDGNRWFDNTGAEAPDPNVLATSTTSGRIQPYLTANTREQITLTDASFTDYKPQINLLPRISFAFPISENSQFYANYDVLTQRPVNSQVSWDDYYFLQQRATLVINNPNLRPEKRTNYELGFNQRISNSSSITMTAYYGQIRDQVQRVQINQAYPITYVSFGNIDFGTVKGFTFGYRYARAGATSQLDAVSGIELNASYTLQFAEGTGSGASSAGNLISAGQPNLRTPFPLDYDVRHLINGIIDYRFGSGKNYQGFSIAGRRILQDAGINFIFNARSGTPYTKQSNVTIGNGGDVQIGVSQRSQLLGTINGSRLPWQLRLDARIDKDIFITARRLDPSSGLKNRVRTGTTLNLFVFIQNVLDAKNIVDVYKFTGLANDDGYLNSQLGKRDASSAIDPVAFYDQYSIKVNDPSNYINPRFFRVGAMLIF